MIITTTLENTFDIFRAIKFFAIVNPAGKFVATVNSLNVFCVVEVAADKKVCGNCLE